MTLASLVVKNKIMYLSILNIRNFRMITSTIKSSDFGNLKRLIPVVAVLFLYIPSLYSQQEAIEIEGGIRISISEDAIPVHGTIRFNPITNDFEGWNGQWMSLTGSLITHGSGTVTDIDGNRYQTVTIGTQTWMRENLRTTKYHNGDTIPEITIHEDWINDSLGSYCLLSNDETYNVPNGKLYNWFVVENSTSVCPTGWHVPSDTEWTTLTDYLGGLTTAGGKMKETKLRHWSSPNSGATNESGFTGLAGGRRNHYGDFANHYTRAYWWSSTEISASEASGRRVSYNDAAAYITSFDKDFGCSIRCLKD